MSETKNTTYYISMDKVSKGTLYTVLPAKYSKLVDCFTSHYDNECREVHVTPKLTYDDKPKVKGVAISVNYDYVHNSDIVYIEYCLHIRKNRTRLTHNIRAVTSKEEDNQQLETVMYKDTTCMLTCNKLKQIIDKCII